MDYFEDKVDLWVFVVIMMFIRIYIYIFILGYVFYENYYVLYMFNDSNLGMIYCVEKKCYKYNKIIYR